MNPLTPEQEQELAYIQQLQKKWGKPPMTLKEYLEMIEEDADEDSPA